MKTSESTGGPTVLNLGPGSQQDAALEKAAMVLREGGLVAYPTETFYGLGADVSNPDFLEKVFQAKGRDYSKPLLVCADCLHSLEGLVEHIPEEALLLMDRFWPGALTLILPARPHVNPFLTGGRGKVGVRVPGNPAARELAARAGNPITGTSANRSGMPGPVRWEQVVDEMGDDIDLILAWPETLPGVGSTIIDVCEGEPLLVRAGIAPVGEIQEVLGRDLKTRCPPR